MVDYPQDVLEQIRDSVMSITPRIAQIVENSSPTPYVTENLTISKYNLCVAVFAMLFGLLGALFGFLGYKWSKKTARNVERITAPTQLAIAMDLVQEIYRRIVYSRAMIILHNNSENVISTLKFPAFSLIIFHRRIIGLIKTHILFWWN